LKDPSKDHLPKGAVDVADKVMKGADKAVSGCTEERLLATGAVKGFPKGNGVEQIYKKEENKGKPRG